MTNARDDITGYAARPLVVTVGATGVELLKRAVEMTHGKSDWWMRIVGVTNVAKKLKMHEVPHRNDIVKRVQAVLAESVTDTVLWAFWHFIHREFKRTKRDALLPNLLPEEFGEYHRAFCDALTPAENEHLPFVLALTHHVYGSLCSDDSDIIRYERDRFRLWGEDSAGLAAVAQVPDQELCEYLQNHMKPWWERRFAADALMVLQRRPEAADATTVSTAPSVGEAPLQNAPSPSVPAVPLMTPPTSVGPPTVPKPEEVHTAVNAPSSTPSAPPTSTEAAQPVTSALREPWQSLRHRIVALPADDEAWQDAAAFVADVQRLFAAAMTQRSRMPIVRSLERLVSARTAAGDHLADELQPTLRWRADDFLPPYPLAATRIDAVTEAVQACLVVMRDERLAQNRVAFARRLIPLVDELQNALVAAHAMLPAAATADADAVPIAQSEPEPSPTSPRTPPAAAREQGLSSAALPPPSTLSTAQAPVHAPISAGQSAPPVGEDAPASRAVPTSESGTTGAPEPASASIADVVAPAVCRPDPGTPEPSQIPPGSVTVASSPSTDVSPGQTVRQDNETTATAPSPLHVPTVSAGISIPGWVAWFGSRWVSPGGRVRPAPWQQPGWIDSLVDAQRQALTSCRMTEAFIFARAIESDAPDRVVEHSEDLLTLAAMTGNGRVPAALDGPRLMRIAAQPSCLALALACLRFRTGQVLPPSLDPHQVDMGLVRDAMLRSVLTDMLRIMAAGHAPVDVVRDRLGSLRVHSPEAMASACDASRTAWKALVQEMWSSGSQIPRTHCRRAWDDWIESAKPFFEAVYPEGGRVDILIKRHGDLVVQARRIRGDAKRIFDKHNAFHEDRKKLDKLVTRLMDAFEDVLEHVDGIAAARSSALRSSSEIRLATEAWSTLRNFPCHHPVEEQVRQLVMRHISNGGAPTPAVSLSMASAALAAMPAALPAFQPASVVFQDVSQPIDVPSSLVDPRLAAACLLVPAAQQPRHASQDVQALVPRLIRVERQEPVAAVLLERLTPAGQLEARGLISDVLTTIVGRCDALMRRAQVLHAMAIPGAEELIRQCTSLRALYATGSSTSRPTQGPFPPPAVAETWLTEALAQVEAAIQTHTVILRRLGDRLTGESARQFNAAVASENWDDAVLLTHGATREVSAHDSGRGPRDSLWRDQAPSAWPDAHAELDRLASEDGAFAPLATSWLDWSGGTYAKRPHTELKALLSKRLVGGKSDGTTASIENTRSLLSVDCADIRRCLAGDRANHLPQLRSFDRLVVATLEVEESRFVEQTLYFLRKEETAKAIAIILAPGISSSTRAECVRGAAHAGLRVAVFDDLDILRVIHARDILPAICEVAFEQFPLEELSPYSCVDGSHLQPEIFVGRREQARRMAIMSLDSSRVFSGRRLGKSALLKYIGERYNGYVMPSQNTLRVVYLSIIGEDREDRVVERILDGLNRTFAKRWTSTNGSPAERFDTLVNRVLNEQPTDNLLIVLDEADSFVAAQLAEATSPTRQNATLAMHMSRIQMQDANGFPRVRFVVAGYAATSKREGQWLNWSTPVSLSPLEKDEAAELIIHPMARLGLDAEAVASLAAFRCGYQPAVIHALCQHIVAHISQTDDDRLDGRIRIDEGLFRSACASPEVITEIKSVTTRNFQDDEAAGIVFQAVIDIFHGMPQFTPLINPDEQIAALLERLSGDATNPGDLGWLAPGDRSAAIDRIRDLLANFVERSLLVIRPSDNDLGSKSYALRYPHHLAVLWDPRMHQIIRDRIATYRAAGHTDGPMPRCVTGDDILELRMLFAPDAIVSCGRIGTHWPEFYLDDTSSGLRAALELDAGLRDSIVRVDPVLLDARRVDPLQTASVVIGGAWLLRQKELPREITFATNRIVPGPVNRRWRRDRGIAFPDPVLFTRLYDLTGGIPLLLAHIDRWLKNEEHITPDRVAALDQRLQAAFPDMRKTLTTGPDSLMAREMDLLRRLLALPPDEGGHDAKVHLTDPDLWRDTASRHQLPLTPIDPSVAGSDLRVLLGLGLVPDVPGTRIGPPWDRLAPIAAQDPIRQLVG
jgi:hypothetical protein